MEALFLSHLSSLENSAGDGHPTTFGSPEDDRHQAAPPKPRDYDYLAALRSPEGGSHRAEFKNPTGDDGSASGKQAQAPQSSTTRIDFSKYRYIIIGSGMGGGMLARKLIANHDNNGTDGLKGVLLLEKGGLQFHSHCLNTSRKHFEQKSQDGRGRDNEVMFDRYLVDMKTKYTLKNQSEELICGGGSVFELGGRSLFWSLEAPYIRNDRLEHFFPEAVVIDLKGETKSLAGTNAVGGKVQTTQTGEGGYYDKAMRIVTNNPPGDVSYPKQYVSSKSVDEVAAAKLSLAKALGGITPLKKIITSSTNIQSPQNGAEFADADNLYYFAQNAYSTSDWIQDRVFNQPEGDNPLLATNLYASAEKLIVGKEDEDHYVTGLRVKVLDKVTKFRVSKKQKIILCAGTVNTAAIALRSDGLPETTRKNIGKNLTDHEIWTARYWKKMTNKESYKAGKAIEMSCYVKVNGHDALLTVCLHAEKFYRHGFADGNEHTDANTELVNVMNILIEFEAELNPKGAVSLDERNEPEIEINRQRLDSSSNFNKELKDICVAIRNEFGFKFDGNSSEGGFDDTVLKLEKWGNVAHEVGTMRMGGPKDDSNVVDSNLKVKGVENLFVCDLSVFPCSPMENPSVTLTALAMRLADHLKEL
ncbi:FAD/NAD(P)-binding domain-containing protein [Nemania abortiva]|nr:FAD/NAD(P)-binding domain-containing protein [Nemania abortiva]